MNELKQTHRDFIEEFKTKLTERRAEFTALGIEYSDEDIGITLTNLMDYLHDKPTDEAVAPFMRENATVMGDVYWSSPYVKALNPINITFSYKGRAVSSKSFGPSVYNDVYGIIWQYNKSFADTFLPSVNTINKYLEGEPEARTALMGEFDFQRYRNWAIIWAKLDWVKLCFPRAYERMLTDDFLSVEEVEEKMKEDQS